MWSRERIELMTKKKVVILGAGFGGIYTYLGLEKYISNFDEVEITIIDRKNYFLFVPMIHEVATGNLEPNSVIQPIRQAIDLSKVRFIEGQIVSVDADARSIAIEIDNETIELSYDYLVMALGSTNQFFGTPGAEHAFVLKDLKDAVRVKHKVIEAFERGSSAATPEEKKKLLTFVTIGGGATGVELTAELADLVNHEMKAAYPGLCEYCSIHLIQSADRLVPQVDMWFHERATAKLKAMGVSVYFDTQVTEITEQFVRLSSGEQIITDTVFWTAGVKAVEVPISGGKNSLIQYDERSRRVQVLPTLQIPVYKEIFVVGDQGFLQDDLSGKPYPMRAQFASRQGFVAGINIASLLRGEQTLQHFNWKDKGFIISLGVGGALAQVYGFKISGPFAWWMYRTAYLLKLIGKRAKFKTAYEWTINLFLPRDISKL